MSADTGALCEQEEETLPKYHVMVIQQYQKTLNVRILLLKFDEGG